MTPRLVQKLGKWLILTGFFLGLTDSTLFLYLFLSSRSPGASAVIGAVFPLPSRPKPPSPTLPKLEEFTPCWRANVSVEPPKVNPAPITPPPPPPKPEQTLQLPFELAGTMVHSQPKKSYAILLDQRTQKQILVRLGKKIPKTAYRVVEIAPDRISISLNGQIALIVKPKPWEALEKKKKKRKK